MQNKQKKSEKRYSKLNSLLIHFLCRKGERKEKIMKGKRQGEKRNNSQKDIEVERFKKQLTLLLIVLF